MTQRTRASSGRIEESDAASTNSTTTKTRRSHKKSRNGCVECKHRHIRCDERKPSCANCDTAERICSFLTPQSARPKQKQRYRELAKQRQHTEMIITPLASSQRNSHSHAEALEERQHAELPRLVSHQRINDSDCSQAPQDLSRLGLTQSYLPTIAGADASQFQIPSPASPMQLSDVDNRPAGCCPGFTTVPDSAPKAIFTPQHMILLHHADKVPNFTAPNRSAVGIAVSHVVGSPYLMDEILAFTAFHMAYLYPGSAAYLRQLATELQNRALTSFARLTKLVPIDDKATAVPRFLFSAILGRHVLADTLTHCSSNFHFFVDRFVECIKLNRGIRSVIPPAKDFLNNTELEPFLSVVHDAQSKIISPGSECNPLHFLMEKSDLNDAGTRACLQAIEILQFCFDLCHSLDVEEYPQAVSVFSVRVEAGFVEVLRKHQPEALVILAYYGVLLFRCRSFWAFGDAGASMIHAIAARLGSYWQEALTWPLRVLETERTPELLALTPSLDTVTTLAHIPT